ncbi:DUF4271 domain-containing protein [Sunxiuqinia sp. A32]|uniref:DUF4271 domain-containing protein n=1 Tax=Sunxiuqinia sp. A32 TaxID=3461496 RepID=UPI004045F944
MRETTIQNDTILKQLDQAVDLKGVNELQVGRKLLEPSKIRMVDSISRRDSLKENVVKQAVDRKKVTMGDVNQSTDTFSMDSVARIEPQALDKMVTEIIAKEEIILPEKKIERSRPDWAVGIFILVFIIFASVRIFFNKYLNQLFYATINYSTASRLFREKTLNLTHAAFRLDILFMIVFSLFLFQLGSELNVSFNHLSFLSYLILLASVIGYFLAKRLAYLIIGIAAESVNETQEYVYNVDLYNRVLGLILLPVSLLIAFASFENPRVFYISGVVVILVMYIMALFRGSKILLRKHFSIFYLILYLCTLEILPLVFIYRLLLV